MSAVVFGNKEDYIDCPSLIVGTFFEHIPSNSLYNRTSEVIQTSNSTDDLPQTFPIVGKLVKLINIVKVVYYSVRAL